MAPDVYERLAQHLDNLPAGYPRTESGVEMRILQRLFTPQHAELALHLTLIPEEARVIAHRAKIPVEEAARRLEEMDNKGLIFSHHRKGKPRKYQAIHFFPGFWEGQVNKLDAELVQDFEAYLPSYGDLDVWRKAPQLRTIPVGESIEAHTEVLAYEQAEGLVRAQKTFAVLNCICRQEMHVLGQGCDHPLESCLAFGLLAKHGVHTGRARPISQEEALVILHRAEDEGRVLQPNNAKGLLSLCTCCACCCAILRTMKHHPRPASISASPFVATLNAATCEGCGTCETRCQMEAVYLDEGKATLDLDRCIGCGLCVATCPSESLALMRKPEPEQPYVPEDIVETLIKVGQARGKLATGELIGMQVKSKVDRLLASR
jgi:Pyruvate/2-oxoacid:ferredoxin oxidoreductase delta subunit